MIFRIRFKKEFSKYIIKQSDQKHDERNNIHVSSGINHKLLQPRPEVKQSSRPGKNTKPVGTKNNPELCNMNANMNDDTYSK